MVEVYYLWLCEDLGSWGVLDGEEEEEMVLMASRSISLSFSIILFCCLIISETTDFQDLVLFLYRAMEIAEITEVTPVHIAAIDSGEDMLSNQTTPCYCDAVCFVDNRAVSRHPSWL